MLRTRGTACGVLLLTLACAVPAVLSQAPTPTTPATGSAQAPSTSPGQGRGRGAAPPSFISPEVAADRRITFRILAPNAQAIRLAAGDIPGWGRQRT